MDPIHPITPRPPALAPIAPAPSDRAARDRREERRRAAAQARRGAGEEGGPREPPTGHSGEEAASPYDAPEDGPRHIDVRA
jgi:hypothetical protein